MEQLTETNEEILVKNAEGEPNTKATIIHRNNINYEPKVSVIIPVFNTEKYLRECLDSIVNQTLKEIEIICVDDGSTDSSLDILKEYASKDNRFTIITQENLHAGVARNAGLAVAKGEYVSFIDSDDYIKLEYLEKLHDKIVLEKADICVCKRYILDSRTNEIKVDENSIKSNLLPIKPVFALDDIYFNIFQFCEIGVWQKLYRRSFIINNKLFFQKTKTLNDVYFNHTSLILAEAITFINVPLIIYRYFNSNQLTASRGNDIDTLLNVYKKIIKFCIKKNLLNKVEESLYVRLIKSGKYEIKLCQNNKNKLKMQRKLVKFLPNKYKQYIIKEKEEEEKLNWYKYIFSVKNDNNHKNIRILGIKIKIKRKHQTENNLVSVNLNTGKINKTKITQNNRLNEEKQLNYVNYDELANIIRENIQKIPENIDLIVGVPRSGMIPAYMIALRLNKRVCSLNEFLNEIPPKNGRRNIFDKENKIKNVLFVDDSIYSGKALNQLKNELKQFKKINNYNVKFLAIFATQKSAGMVDYFFKKLETPRLFNWNYLNHSFATNCCYDIDGVLCIDPTKEQNDDGEKYIDFIKNATPLYIPTYKIKAIVTSRLEKYRKETEEWLVKHNIKYEKLYMLNMKTAEERRQANCHASFKADIYKKITNSGLFVESNSRQAKEIHALTGKPVICVETDVMYK